MNRRYYTAILMCLVLLAQLVFGGGYGVPERAAASTPALSAAKLTVRVGSKKTLKVKNTSYKVTFSISTGSTRIKLTSKKKYQVTIKGVKVGSAKVKAKVKLTSKKTKTLTCKVTIKDSIWYCPTCGQKNDTNYCSNCGTARGADVKATATPTPTPSPTPTVAPVGPDALSTNTMWIQINDGYYVLLQMYGNATATDFYSRVRAGSIDEIQMMPMNSNERVAYLSSPVQENPSVSREMKAGDVYMYDQYTLKVAVSDHISASYPTRIARIYDQTFLSAITDGITHDKESKTKVKFFIDFS